VRAPTITRSVARLRFFFTVTLGRGDMGRHLTFVREPRNMVVVLSPEELARLLEAALGPRLARPIARNCVSPRGIMWECIPPCCR
jgi:integrase/recombinase XerD